MPLTSSTPESSGLLAVLRPLLVKHEDRRLRVYLDSKGIPSIGIGFNLNRSDARAICQQCGADYDALRAGTAVLTDAQCEFIYEHCVIEVLQWIVKLFPQWTQFSTNRMAALVDMGFNLGPARFGEFHQMVQALRAQNWPLAAEQALNSSWAGQVGSRAHDDVALILAG